jgi:acylpyruvate hydrolase
MRLVTFQSDEGPAIGMLRDDGVIAIGDIPQEGAIRSIPPNATADMTAFLAWANCDFEALERATAGASSAKPLSEVKLLAPVPRPGKIIGVGRNYGAHAAEGGLGRQEEPRLFVKMSSSVIGPDDAIERPTGIVKLDWEVELAAVVGQVMKNVGENEALDHVAGFMLLNDVSAREYQFDVTPPQTTFAKSMDTFTPTGPWLATRSSFDGSRDHELRCFVNGELMQSGNTHDMIFSTAYILSYVSRFVTLEPGDIVATGTPSGVGHFRDPPLYLRPGDTVRLEIPGLGVLQNPVVEAGGSIS